MALEAVTRLRMRYLSALRHRRRGRPVEAVPALLELARSGPAQLSQDARDEQAPLHIATVIPSFRRGSGGHATIVNLLRELRALGHSVSVWLEDVEGRHASEQEAVTKRAFSEFYRADGLDLQTGFQAWRGADVVLATGWQTVARALLLPGAGARAYLVQDHEPEFYGTSAQSLWAAWTYRQGLHCIAASRWLAELLHARYDASTSHFDLAVDHAVYGAADEPRRDDLVVFYARDATPRRAVPLGLLALNELSRRRPNVELCLYGEGAPLQAPFTHRHLGVLDAARLAQLYRRAAVGMVLSLTNPSLVSLEMVASGLPCVELASESMLSEFGAQGPLTLSEADPLALCTALDGLLADPGRRTSAARAGLELVGERTWARAAVQVQAGLRRALQMAANPSGREPTRSPLQP